MPTAVLPRHERRTVVRYVSRSRVPCRLRCNTGEGPWLATIRNISPGGIGLIANRPFKPGMFLTVELPSKTQVLMPRLLRITHAAPQEGNHWWVVGGVFASPLTRDEMAALV